MKTFAAMKRSVPPARRAPMPAPSPRSAVRRAEVRQILHGPRLQNKLTVGEPDDKFEREADRVADQVMRMPDSQVANSVVADPGGVRPGGCVRVQRLCKECEEEKIKRQPLEEEEEIVQAKTRDGGVPRITGEVAAGIRSLKGGGRPLPDSARSFFEPRFGADLRKVRVHADSNAGELARRVEARAFTVGRDIVFGPGQYAPGVSAGRKLLAHELTHTIQQTSPNTSSSARPKAPQSTHELTSTVQRQHVADTGWRYTLPEAVARSIIEIQGVVGTNPDGIYGPNTRKAVIKYQKKLKALKYYKDTVDGKWGKNTDAAHVLFAAAPNVQRRGYNCAGFAFKNYRFIDMSGTRAIYSGMTKLPDCSNSCSPFHHKFWYWEVDVGVTHMPTGATAPKHRDFHTVGGQTDKDGQGPKMVMSKNGPRPVEGPSPPLSWRPVDGPVIDADGNPEPDFRWSITNVDLECFCNKTLPP